MLLVAFGDEIDGCPGRDELFGLDAGFEFLCELAHAGALFLHRAIPVEITLACKLQPLLCIVAEDAEHRCQIIEFLDPPRFADLDIRLAACEGGHGFGRLFQRPGNESARDDKSTGKGPDREQDHDQLDIDREITDFGAARSEVARNHALRDAEKLRLADQAEDIAVRTVNAFLNLLEQEEMIRHIDETVRQQRALADLVKLSEQGGNGTRADLDRIRAKVIETEATRTDIKTAYQTALDEFQRLTGLKPQQVRRPSFRANLIPKSVEQAVADARRSNPSLMAMDATGVAFNHQIEGLKAQTMPKVEFIGDALNKHYAGGRKICVRRRRSIQL